MSAFIAFYCRSESGIVLTIPASFLYVAQGCTQGSSQPELQGVTTSDSFKRNGKPASNDLYKYKLAKRRDGLQGFC